MSKQMTGLAAIVGVVFAVAVVAVQPAHAANGTWNADAAGDWSVATNWLADTIAHGAGATANLTYNISDDRTITIDGGGASRTLGILNIGDSDGSHGYTIDATGGGTLTFDNNGSNAQLNQTGTNNADVLSAPILLNDSLGIDNASTEGLILSGVISGDGALAKTGVGRLTLLGANTYSGGTTLQTRDSMLLIGVDSVGTVDAIISSAFGAGPLTIGTPNGPRGGLSSDSTAPRTILNPVRFVGRAVIGDATNNGKLTFKSTVDLGGQPRLSSFRSDVQFDGIVSSSGTPHPTNGGGGFDKGGVGTLTFTGDNTFIGRLKISAGMVFINGDQSAATGPVTVRSGAALGGRGIIGGTVTIESGGIVAPGQGVAVTSAADLAGTLTVNAEITLADDTAFDVDLVGAASDKLAATGAATIGANASLNIVAIGSRDGTGEFKAGTYTLIAAAGVSGTFATVTDLGAYVSAGPGGDGVTYNADSITLTLEKDLNPGDGNLDGQTDVSDRILWNNNNFTFGTMFQTGDYNGDGQTDVSDRIIWNNNNFTFATAGAPLEAPIAAVPEPATMSMLGLAGLAIALKRRRVRP